MSRQMVEEHYRHLTLDDLVSCILTKHCDPPWMEEETVVDIANRITALEKRLDER